MSRKNLILVLILIAAGIFAGLYAFPRTSSDKPGRTPQKEYKSGNLSIQSELSKEKMQTIASFLEESLNPSLMPQELVLRPATKGEDTSGIQYFGSWNKDGTFVQFLYVEGTDDKNPLYYRVWTLPLGENITREQASSLAAENFRQEYLASLGELSCRENKVQDKNVTECASLKTASDGSLKGVTVRAPIESAGQPSAIMVSACLVPKEGTPMYAAPSCI